MIEISRWCLPVDCSNWSMFRMQIKAEDTADRLLKLSKPWPDEKEIAERLAEEQIDLVDKLDADKVGSYNDRLHYTI